MPRFPQSASNTPPPEPPLEPARIWLQKFAKWTPPNHEPPSRNRSFSEVPKDYLDFVCTHPPQMAFFDKDKAGRYIKALNNYLQDTPLVASVEEGNGTLSPNQVRYLYAKLFYPLCSLDEGIQKDMWRVLSNEVVCNRLTHEAILHAVKIAAKRLLGQDIYVATEPMQPNVEPGSFNRLTSVTLKKKVDFAVFLEILHGIDKPLLLVEGKTPTVLSVLIGLLSGEPIILDFNQESPTQGEKFLFKLVYYMTLWRLDLLVVTSFQESIILELHETENGLKFLSYSPVIETKENTELFRALLGIIVAKLDLADFVEFDAGTAYTAFRTGLQADANERVDRRATRNSGPPPRGGPPGGAGGAGGVGRFGRFFGGGRSSGSGGGGGSSKKDSSGRGGNTKSSGKRGTKSSYEATGETLTATEGAVTCASQRITRSMSKSLVAEESKATVESMAPHPNIESLHIIGPGIDLLVDRDSSSPFPKLSTSAQVPCLQVIRKLECLNGLLYKTILYGPESKTTGPMFFVKVVDVSVLTFGDYRNSLAELLKEYRSYYRLALAKRNGICSEVIQKFTPTCYGLYLNSGKPGLFALVVEDVGDVDLTDFILWSGSDKVGVIQSLIVLHSIGLKHGDPDERNVGIDRSHNHVDATFRFFDFGCSSWHLCRGITECRELKEQIRKIYNMQPPPWVPEELEERTVREFDLPFCNLADIVDGMELFETEPPVMHLKILAPRYEQEFTESQSQN